jgi:FKBP-type peptidyl-prolyl cis-trans isomerase SlyD
MKIAKHTIVGLEYALHLGDGAVIDASAPGQPLHYLHGGGQIVPGLERALEGQEPGAEQQVVVSPDDGYGPRDEQAVRTVPREAFPADAPLEVGAELVVVDEHQNQVPLKIQAIENGTVTVDFNHPLAGKTLHFKVKVVEVRAATEEEITHGHAHGDDGHHH